MDPYEAELSRLNVVVADRNDEIAALRTQLEDAMRQAKSAAKRMNHLEREVRDLTSCALRLNTELKSAAKDCERHSKDLMVATRSNEYYKKRVAELQKHVEESVLLRRGSLTSLGVSVAPVIPLNFPSSSRDEFTGGVKVGAVGPPALGGGLQEGDLIQRVVLEKLYPIHSMDDFQRFQMELLPHSVAHLRVRRGGSAVDLTVTPESHRPTVEEDLSCSPAASLSVVTRRAPPMSPGSSVKRTVHASRELPPAVLADAEFPE